jgi:hypothetical protein
VLLQGESFRGWEGAAFDDAVRRTNAAPAPARISLGIRGRGADALHVDATAVLSDPAGERDAALYLGAYEDRAGTRVVLEWQGPIGFLRGRAFAPGRRLALLPNALPAGSGAVGFVQDRRTGRILQALLIPAC